MGGRGTNGRVSRPTTEYHKTPDLKDYNRTASSRSIDEAAVNTNPNYRKPGTGEKYISNCQRCVLAYELQRRGYNVEARAAVINGTDPFWENAPNTLQYNAGGMISNNSIEPIKSKAGKASRLEIEKKLKEWGDGSRAAVAVLWKNGKSSHVFIAENVGGKIQFIDPQSGSKDVSSYFDPGRTKSWFTVDRESKYVGNVGASIRRLDNAVFTDRIKLAVKNKGSNEE